MKKKAILLLLILKLSIYILNINVQITAEENDYRPTSLELTPHDSISITSDSDFDVFPGSGTEVDPYVIEGYDITTTSDYSIYISDTTRYFTVQNCYFEAEECGILIQNVANGTTTVINNTCSNNNYDGIYLSDSSGATLTDNTCSNNNYDGIHLYSSSSAILTDNTCSNNNYDGIYLSDSSGVTLNNNTCINNRIGIFLSHASGATFNNNTCINNRIGIYLLGHGSCLISYNLLQENKGYGVHLSYSNNNLIHHNDFVDNNLGGTSQASDEGIDNYWYDTETQEGNYWSDWSGTGNYSIDGSANSIDLYSFDEPIETTIDKTQLNFTFTLLIVVVPLILTKTISKKTKKE